MGDFDCLREFKFQRSAELLRRLLQVSREAARRARGARSKDNGGGQGRGFAVFLVPPFGVTGSNPPLRRFNFSKRVAERGGFEPPIQLLGRITI